MSVEIHAWVQVVPVDWWLPNIGDTVIVRTEAGRVTMARYDSAPGNWVELGAFWPMREPVTHWASTHKINRAIERHAEENSDED